MKKLLFLLTFALLPALFAAENLLTAPLCEWKRDFRPGNRKEVYDVKQLDGGITRLRRFAGSSFGRIYQDLKLRPGNVYRLAYTQTTEHGALTKMLVIFKGPDGKWREKTRLSHCEPLVNGEWTTGTMTFQVPEDAVETRIDCRLDSFGTVDLKDVSLTELTPAEAEAYRKSTAVEPFRPGSGNDYALVPGGYCRVRFDGEAPAGNGGTVRIVFHSPDGSFIRDGHITFYLRGGEKKTFSEIIVVSDNADGARVTTGGVEIRNFVFEPYEVK